MICGLRLLPTLQLDSVVGSARSRNSELSGTFVFCKSFAFKGGGVMLAILKCFFGNGSTGLNSAADSVQLAFVRVIFFRVEPGFADDGSRRLPLKLPICWRSRERADLFMILK